jgi:uncharacterized membrane protein YhaH (DUF805 family)
MNKYFGPLSKEYCVYFYYLSIFFFLMYVIILISAISFIIKNYKDIAKVNLSFVINLARVLINMLLSYFVNRLLHTMCVNSIQ